MLAYLWLLGCVEGACRAGGGGHVAGAVAARAVVVHAEAPAGGGGVVGGQRLDAEHDLDLVAWVEGGEAEQGGLHAPVRPVVRLAGFERECAEEGSDALDHEVGLDGAVGVEDGEAVVGVLGVVRWVWGWIGFWQFGHAVRCLA